MKLRDMYRESPWWPELQTTVSMSRQLSYEEVDKLCAEKIDIKRGEAARRTDGKNT